MGMAIKVKMLLAARGMSITDLAKKIDPPTSGQNMSAKLRRDNLSEKELVAIAKACDAVFHGSFVLNEVEKEI